MRSALLLGLTIILFIALLGLAATPALAKGKGHHVVHPRACSKTASAAYIACYNEKKDDYWIAQGNCYNLDDPGDRAECFNDAKKDYNEAKAECRDQLDARKDLCDELGEKPYDPLSDSVDFVDNPTGNDYFPLMPGLWTYKTEDEEGEVTETNTVEVLAGEYVTIEGITCAVVHDRVYGGDQPDQPDPAALKEDTNDWYAQQLSEDSIPGAVWYFGERSLEKEGCEDDEELCDAYLLTDEGSWKTGFDEANPGILMKTDPQVGDIYRQEFALGDAEDAAEVLSKTYHFGEGDYDDPETLDYLVPADLANALCSQGSPCVVTLEFTPLEPDVRERKYYAPGIGVFLEVDLGAKEINKLVYCNVDPKCGQLAAP